MEHRPVDVRASLRPFAQRLRTHGDRSYRVEPPLQPWETELHGP
ncbi:hypothetical protein ACWD6I_00830 [Streptomyces sp. NPDC002454]